MLSSNVLDRSSLDQGTLDLTNMNQSLRQIEVLLASLSQKASSNDIEGWTFLRLSEMTPFSRGVAETIGFYDGASSKGPFKDPLKEPIKDPLKEGFRGLGKSRV